MLEDARVFETFRSCTPGDAGSGPLNLAVLTVNSQHGVMKVLPCVSREREVGKTCLCPKQGWSHAGVWALRQDGAGGGMVAFCGRLGFGRMPVLLHILLSYTSSWKQLTHHHKRKNSTMPGDKEGEKTKCYILLKSRSAHFLQADRARREARRVQGARMAAMIDAPLCLPSLLPPKMVVAVWSEGSEVTVWSWKGPILLKALPRASCILSSISGASSQAPDSSEGTCSFNPHLCWENRGNPGAGVGLSCCVVF